jgi:hypothetical protein
MKNIGLVIFIASFLLSCGHKTVQIESNFTENIILKLANEYNNIYTSIINNDKNSFVEYFEIEEDFYKYLMNTIANNKKFDRRTFLVEYNTLIDNIPNGFDRIMELENLEYKYFINFNIIVILFVFEAIYLGEITDTPMNEIFDNINIKNLNMIKKLFVEEDVDIIKKYKKHIIETVFLQYGRGKYMY